MAKAPATAKKKKYFLWLFISGMLVGIAFMFFSIYAVRGTNSLEFCISCHTMQTPYAEYQGSVHYKNTKGIRAVCSDCHVPHTPGQLIWAKIMAAKDVWNTITGKIDTPEKFEKHKLEMAQTVWAKLKAQDSATCKSCHSFEAMDILKQRPEAKIQHTEAIANNLTCVDCHRGVAHILPDMSQLNKSGAAELTKAAAMTSQTAKTLYSIGTQPFFLSNDSKELEGTIMPSTQASVIERKGDLVLLRISGWQPQSTKEVLFTAIGKRIIQLLIGENGVKKLKVISSEVYQETGEQWNQVSIDVWAEKSKFVDDDQKIWSYAKKLINANCTGCHAAPHLSRFNANQWVGVVKGMAIRTSLTNEELSFITQYGQKHANDSGKTE